MALFSVLVRGLESLRAGVEATEEDEEGVPPLSPALYATYASILFASSPTQGACRALEALYAYDANGEGTTP